MTAVTLTIIISVLSLFTFIAIFIPTLRDEPTFKANRIILIASFSLFISNFSQFIDLSRVDPSSPSFLLTFICYSTITLSFLSLLKLIVLLYSNKYELKYSILIIYSILIGFLFSGLAVLEVNYLLNNVIYGALTSIPVFITVHIFVKEKVRLYTNVFFYQFIILGFMYFVKIVNIYMNKIDATNAYDCTIDLLINMFTAILIITIFTSYLFEKQSKTILNLKRTECVLEQSLYKANTQSETDQLTGLSNRYKIEKDLNALYKKYIVKGEKFSLLMCDLDNFKDINDEYGHNIGDEVLQHTSVLLKTTLRNNDIIGRWGGDEFIVILPNTDETNVPLIISKINMEFSHEKSLYNDKQISLSVGSSTIDTDITIRELISAADAAMYLNKN